MALFVSKVLPLLLLYPLGVVSVLLLVALGMLWRKSRWSAVPVGAALAIIWLSSNAWTTNGILQSLEWRHIPTGELPAAEAIVLLGGATSSQSYPRPGIDFSERADRVVYTAQLYHRGKAPIIILSGGRIEWMEGGQAEATDIAQELVNSFKVPRSALIEEPDSLNTYENAVNVKKILTQRQIQRVLLVTSASHMPRSLRIFRKLNMDVIPAPTDFLAAKQQIDEPNQSWEAAILGIIPDSRRLEKFTMALKEYIGMWIYIVKGWA
jgi:uncharacterized SAM-binding protein YcdF (DUF218 family)